MSPDPSPREVSAKFRDVLFVMDTFMGTRWDAELSWIQIAAVLGLASTRGRSITELADELRITKQAVSKGCDHVYADGPGVARVWLCPDSSLIGPNALKDFLLL